MKKMIALVFILALLSGCSNSAKDIPADAAMETGVSAAVIAKEYAMEFNPETNSDITFQNLSIQIPASWHTYQQDEEFIMWLPEYDSDTEYAQVYLLVMGRWGYSEESIHSSELQLKVQNAVAERFLNGIENVEVMNSSIGKVQTEYYLYSVSGVHHTDLTDVAVKVSTYTFVVDDKLYMLLYQSSSEDSFDYSHDVISVLSSVREYTEPLSTEETVFIESSEQIAVPEESNYNTSEPSIEDIGVRFIVDSVDNNRLHLKVYTKNDSGEIFSGNVYVIFYSADGEDKLGSDTIFFEGLQPGQESWANVTIDMYRGTPKMVVDFSEVTFIPLEQITGEIDQEISKKVKRSYELNFEGVSWYNDIIKIEAYTDGNCVVTIVNNPKEGGQFYANVIWQCGEQHGIDTVKVVDMSGNVKALY